MDDSWPLRATHAEIMRTATPLRLAAAAAALAGLAACGATAPSPGGQSGTGPTSTVPSPAATTPAPSGSTTQAPTAPPGSIPSATPSAPPPSTSPGPAGITGGLAGKDWTYIPTSRRVVALTFDAGANADAVPSILATLRHEGVPATFFLTGNFVRDFPAAARAIAAAGFRIGDHTITHPYLTQLGDAAVRQEILGGAQQIISVTGKNPAPLFRFPYGDADARTIAIANQAGYVPVRWTVDTLGWEGSAGHISSSVVVSRVLAAARPGEIVLMHVGSNPDDHTTYDADALPQVINGLRAEGYSFVSLDALTG
jgi:peptidoglycan/xylan/chitin deacetylase (PgdA/CDA1 family)